MDSLLKKTTTVSIVGVTIVFMIIIAYQQRQIHLIQDRADLHDSFIAFMQEGERFSFVDGKALFLIATEDGYVSEKTKQAVWNLYEGNDTNFSMWLRNQNICMPPTVETEVESNTEIESDPDTYPDVDADRPDDIPREQSIEFTPGIDSK